MIKTTIKVLNINPLASPGAGAPTLKYGDVNTETTSPSEVKGLISVILKYITKRIRNNYIKKKY